MRLADTLPYDVALAQVRRFRPALRVTGREPEAAAVVGLIQRGRIRYAENRWLPGDNPARDPHVADVVSMILGLFLIWCDTRCQS